MSDSKFCEIPIKIINLYGKSFPFAIYLKLSEGNAVKLTNENENLVEIFNRYEKKGVIGVYVQKDDFAKFIKDIKEKSKKALLDPSTLEEDKVKILADTYRVAKEGLKNFGVKPETIKLAKVVNESALMTMEETPNVYRFLEEFKDKCGKELYTIMLINFVISGMVDTFEWSSPALKEKITIGSLLCDVLLDENDFNELRENIETPDHLSMKAKNHPMDTYEKFCNCTGALSKESLEIIKFHHEKPCGGGFPYSIPGKNISLFPAIRIVADRFVSLLISENFDINKRNNIIMTLDSEFQVANFKTAFSSLKTMLG